MEDDGVPFPERFAALQATFEEQFLESDRLTALIREKLGNVIAPSYNAKTFACRQDM